jgi:serine O-acetyltransferase
MWHALQQDAARYADCGKWYACPGFWLTAVYRYGTWAHSLPSPIRLPMWLLYRVAHLPYQLFNLHLWAGRRGSRIGPGLLLIHPNNIYFGPGVEIGANCEIYHEVTLGMGHVPGTPKIGDSVNIYSGARVLGGVRIGARAMIGANAVVVRDVPDDMVVMPPVSRLLPRTLSAIARIQDRKPLARQDQ